MDDTELDTQKFQDFQDGQKQFMQDSKLCRFKILGKSRNLQDFDWFSSNSGQNSQNFEEIHGILVKLTELYYRISSVVRGGRVDIF